MPRSLKVRPQCLIVVKSSLLRNGFPSQKILAEDLGLAQSTVSSFLNGKPVDYINFLEICGRLGQEWRNIADLEDKSPQEDIPPPFKVKIALSDRHSQHQLTVQLKSALVAASHEVLIIEKNAKLDTYLQQSDYLLLLLSAQSVVSEILLEEVRLAKELQTISPQKPAILPICIDLSPEIPISFDLSQLLQGIQPWQWRCAEDTIIVISEILNLITEGRTSLNSEHRLAFNWTTIPAFSHTSSTPNSVFELNKNLPIPLPVAAPELPGGQVELASSFYMQRSPIESRCYETITQPGALIRIKAPRQMGKTSLMARILHHAESQGSRIVSLSFQLANKRVFANSDTFLQWFCASIGLELGQLDALAKCWELADIIGSNQCCKAYFEQYILSELSTPLTLGLDEVDRIFESPEIADDFLGLLRALHEEAKRRDLWKKFRLIVVHSTEVYIPIDINKSPFNVGLPIELPEFNTQQVEELAQRHGLNWDAQDVDKLMGLVGGHPYLVRLAMYHICRQDVTLNQIVEMGATESSIYSDHLRRHLWNLEKYPDLMAAMREVLMGNSPVKLRSDLGFKLNSMGLVKLHGNDCTPICNLYQQYFGDRLYIL